MRPAALVALGCLVATCASSRPVVAPTAAVPSAPQTLAGARRTQEFDSTSELRQGPIQRNNTIEIDELPPAFAELSPRDRERWHACHIFFLRGLPQREHMPDPRPFIEDGAVVGRTIHRQHLGFTVTPAQYVATPEAARRGFLIQHGCPDSLVDLADGTHLDLIEQP